MRISIIGSGYGGAIIATLLKKIGHDVVLIERDSHPKFSIGESSTPLANFLLEELGKKYDLPHLYNLSTWGRWQKHHPDIEVGLKRGFSFFFLDDQGNVENKETMCVAASPDEQVADTHWYRPQFDLFLVDQAVKHEVTYLEKTVVESVDFSEEKLNLSLVERNHIKKNIKVDYLIDATGNHSFSSEHLSISESSPHREEGDRFAVYAHFQNVSPISNALKKGSISPYPLDDSAIHFLFEGGWIWILRFNNGIVSTGVSISKFSQLGNLEEEEAPTIWRTLLDRLPAIKKLFSQSQIVTPFYKSHSLEFIRGPVTGDRWIKLPSSCGFVDPLLSTGFSLNLLGIGRLANFFLRNENLSEESFMKSYSEKTLGDLQTASSYIKTLLSVSHDSKEFKKSALVYFIGIIQQEIKSRLNLIPSYSDFLYKQDNDWRALASELLSTRYTLDQILEKLSSWDLGGVLDYPNWMIPASKNKLLSNCHKIPASKHQIELMLNEARSL